ncbi:MAG: hypothetical protein QXN56_01385 [Candidatus Hadarchaeum sp.]
MSLKVGQTLELIGGATVTGIPAPVQSTDAVNKSYVDSLVEGLSWKDDCRVATQGNINLSSPGASIDGVAMELGDRVLVKAQTSSAENGIYVWNGASSPMTRASDANTAQELWQAVTSVREGTDAGTSWRQTYLVQTLDTDPVQWSAFSAAAPPASETQAGIIEIATQAEVDAGTDDQRAVTPLKLANWAGRIKKYATTIGDGTNTQFTLTHNLNTQDVQVSIYSTSGSYDEVLAEIRHLTANTVQVVFASAPPANAYRVVIIG